MPMTLSRQSGIYLACNASVLSALLFVAATSTALAQVTLPRILQGGKANSEPIVLDLQGIRYRQADLNAIAKAAQELRLQALTARTVGRLQSYQVGPIGPCRYMFSRVAEGGVKEVLAIVHDDPDRGDVAENLPDARAGSYIGLSGYEIPATLFGVNKFTTTEGGTVTEKQVKPGRIVAVGPTVALYESNNGRGMLIDKTARLFFERDSSTSCSPSRDRCRLLRGRGHLVEYGGISLRDQIRAIHVGKLDLEVQCGGPRSDVMPEMDIFSVIRRLLTTLPH